MNDTDFHNLLVQLRNGELGAVDKLHDEFAPALDVALRRKWKPEYHPEVEHAVQETFAGLGGEYLPNEGTTVRSFRNWLLRIADTMVTGEYRRANRGERHRVPFSEVEEFPAPEIDWEHMNLIARMWKAVDALPEKMRVVFHLRWVEGMTYAEITERTGVPDGTLKAWHRRGLELLQQDLGNIELPGCTVDAPTPVTASPVQQAVRPEAESPTEVQK